MLYVQEKSAYTRDSYFKRLHAATTFRVSATPDFALSSRRFQTTLCLDHRLALGNKLYYRASFDHVPFQTDQASVLAQL